MASALNDRQISITTYKMIDRRYTSAHFKDTSEKQPRRWVKTVTRPFSHRQEINHNNPTTGARGRQ